MGFYPITAVGGDEGHLNQKYSEYVRRFEYSTQRSREYIPNCAKAYQSREKTRIPSASAKKINSNEPFWKRV